MSFNPKPIVSAAGLPSYNHLAFPVRRIQFARLSSRPEFSRKMLPPITCFSTSTARDRASVSCVKLRYVHILHGVYIVRCGGSRLCSIAYLYTGLRFPSLVESSIGLKRSCRYPRPPPPLARALCVIWVAADCYVSCHDVDFPGEAVL